VQPQSKHTVVDAHGARNNFPACRQPIACFNMINIAKEQPLTFPSGSAPNTEDLGYVALTSRTQRNIHGGNTTVDTTLEGDNGFPLTK
jgi:hypothetical protein